MSAREALLVGHALDGADQALYLGFRVGRGAGDAQHLSRGSGSGYNQAMTFAFRDSAGWQDLDVVNILINGTLDGRNACYLAYSQPSKTLYLVNDDGAGLSRGLVPVIADIAACL